MEQSLPHSQPFHFSFILLNYIVWILDRHKKPEEENLNQGKVGEFQNWSGKKKIVAEASRNKKYVKWWLVNKIKRIKKKRQLNINTTIRN